MKLTVIDLYSVLVLAWHILLTHVTNEINAQWIGNKSNSDLHDVLARSCLGPDVKCCRTQHPHLCRS